MNDVRIAPSMAAGTELSLVVLVVLGIGAAWLAARTKLPSILLLLLAGFLAGPVTGLVDPDALLGDLLIPVVSLSVGLILFEGGLSLRLVELREVGGVVRNLVTVGVAVTWAIATGAAMLLFGLGPGLALLIGAILVVSGPTVIIPILRQLRPRGPVAHSLKWEGILIDPIGVVLAVLVFEALLVGGLEQATTTVVTTMIKALLAGAAAGVAGAAVIFVAFRRHWVPDALQNPVTLMVVLASFAAANAVQTESGLVAATVMGVVLGNQREVGLRHIMEFKENVRVLLVSFLFVLLAARLRTDALALLDVSAFVFLGVLLFVARPLTVALSTWRSPLPWRERVFLAGMAPRGIVAALVASVFALELEALGRPNAELIVPITFFVIIGTVLVYGLAAAPLARALKVADPDPQGVVLVGAHPWARELALALQKEDVRVALWDTNRRNIIAAWDEGLPAQQANTLSETVLDDVDLEGMGHLFCMTSNDEVNALTGLHFREVFERARIYQIAPGDPEAATHQAVPAHLRGRMLFSPDLSYPRIVELRRAGWRVTTVPIEEGHAIPEDAHPLVRVRGGRVAPYTRSRRPEPAPGDRIIVLAPPAEG